MPFPDDIQSLKTSIESSHNIDAAAQFICIEILNFLENISEEKQGLSNSVVNDLNKTIFPIISAISQNSNTSLSDLNNLVENWKRILLIF